VPSQPEADKKNQKLAVLANKKPLKKMCLDFGHE